MGAYESQVRALDEAALVRPMPKLGTIIVTGEDRQSWLAGMLTSDVAGLSQGGAGYALSVNKTGRIQSDLWVLVAEGRILLGVPRERLETLRAALEGYLIMEDAELQVSADGWSWWIAHGQEAHGVAHAARGAGAIAATGTLGGCPTAVVAAGTTVEPNLGEVLTAAQGTILATPDAWERIRIERLLPELGRDYEAEMYPQEARLEDLCVSFNKGCYLGQEAVFMLQKRGRPPKRLVTLRLPEASDAAPGKPIETSDGTTVGELKSCVSVGEGALALAMVKYKHSEEGTQLSVGNQPAVIVAPKGGFH